MKNNKYKFLFILVSMLALVSVETFAQNYKVGVCDWMMLKRQKIGEFKLAKQVGADGVEMDMGGLGKRDSFQNELRNPEKALAFKNACKENGMQVASIAMSGFYGQSFAKKQSYKWLVEDCLNTMDDFGVKVCYLPLGGCGKGWEKDKKLRKEIVKRLREVGKMAKQKGKIIGIDTPLDAAGNLKLLKEINSPAVKIFYKFQNVLEAGAKIPEDIKKLGKTNICAIHATNTDGLWARVDPAVDMIEVKYVLDSIGWQGWLFVERARDARVQGDKRVGNDVKVVRNFSANTKYLKEIFQSGRDIAYVKNIQKRAIKVTDKLAISGTSKGKAIEDIVMRRYFALNDIYAERDTLKKQKNKHAEEKKDQALYRSHFAFDADLRMYLTEEEVETVKNVMTYDVVNVTYKAYCDMLPNLDEEEKQQIMCWLKEARELALDAETSNKKHEVFKKYKGRINNYLSLHGYDLTKERQKWGERVKAQGGTL